MMLPLSTIEGKDTPTEEVKTKPPEKGGERPLGGKLWAGGVGRVSRAGLGGKGWPCSLAPAPASPSGSSCPCPPPCEGRAGSPPAIWLHSPSTPCSGLLPTGGACGITMLPLSTIRSQEPEEVRTKPPERRGENPWGGKGSGCDKTLFLFLCSLPFQPSVCFTFYLETDDSDSEPKSSPETPKPSTRCASPPKAAAEYQEIQAWECPLCCLSIFCLS
uniref:Uncharacterized protein n=1 Tax=Sus scrofa TaxID=9823 RepID=A0A8D0NRP7_PIG